MKITALVMATLFAAPVPAPAVAPVPVPVLQQDRKPPKEPSKKVAERIETALRTLFSGSTAGRLGARADLVSAVEEWRTDIEDDPLRGTAWWQAALLRSMPEENVKTGLHEVTVPYLKNRKVNFWVSVPKGYRKDGIHPLLLTFLEKGANAKRVISASYGELAKQFLIVAIVMDRREAGFDPSREPWVSGVALRHVVDNYRIDRDRVLVDGFGAGVTAALRLGSEWAVQFSGCILRSPTASTSLLGNLDLLNTLVVAPAEPDANQTKALEALRGAILTDGDAPRLVEVPAGKDADVRIAEWAAAIPARRIADAATLDFKWMANPQGGEVWAYWLWVFRPIEAKPNRPVTVHVQRTAEGNGVALEADNLGEGILLLNDDIVNLDEEVVVTVNGGEVWKGVPERSVDTLLYWIGQSGERSLFVPAEIRFTVPEAAKDAKKPAK